MKIILSEKYKLIESAFEGQIYNRETEDKFVDDFVQLKNRAKKLPMNPNYPYRLKRPGRPPGFRSQYIERIPQIHLEPILKEKEEHKRNFDFNYTKHLTIVKWIPKVQDKNVRNKIESYYREAVTSGKDGLKNIETLFLSSRGDKHALKKLANEIGVDKVTDIPPLSNPLFEIER